MTTTTIQMEVYGVGEVTAEGPGQTTSSEVQEAWTTQVTIINEVVTNINSDPPVLIPSDLDRLVEALGALEDLAENGITVNGTTHYITNDMAEALDDLFAAFAAVGITSDMDTSSMTDEEKIAVLSQASGNEAIQASTNAATGVTYQDLSLQYYAVAMFGDMIAAAGAEFDSLAAYLKFVDEVLELLNALLEMGNYTTVEDPWEAEISLENSGSIPPSLVGTIQSIIQAECESANDDDFDSDDVNDAGVAYTSFYEIYQSELAQATELAEQNGTTVEEEMENFHGASDLLKDFFEEYPEYITEIEQIFVDYNTDLEPEVVVNLTPNELYEVGFEIWDLYEELEIMIEQLTAHGADPDMISCLEDVADNIEAAWDQACPNYEDPEALKAANPPPEGQEYNDYVFNVMMNFSTLFIESMQVDQDGYTDLNTAVVTFQNYNEELQKEFQKQMTIMESLFKMTGAVMKSLNDTYMAIAGNM